MKKMSGAKKPFEDMFATLVMESLNMTENDPWRAEVEERMRDLAYRLMVCEIKLNIKKPVVVGLQGSGGQA